MFLLVQNDHNGVFLRLPLQSDLLYFNVISFWLHCIFTYLWMDLDNQRSEYFISTKKSILKGCFYSKCSFFVGKLKERNFLIFLLFSETSSVRNDWWFPRQLLHAAEHINCNTGMTIISVWIRRNFNLNNLLADTLISSNREIWLTTSTACIKNYARLARFEGLILGSWQFLPLPQLPQHCYSLQKWLKNNHCTSFTKDKS